MAFYSYVMSSDFNPSRFKYFEVMGYYRIPAISSAWNSKILTTSSTTSYYYTADFSGNGIPIGTEMRFKVRLKRKDPNGTDHSVYAWGPAGKYRPGSNPVDAAHWSVYYGYI